MIGYRCKCGHIWGSTSFGVPRCVTCDKCGSTMGAGPNDHLPLEPHNWSEWRWEINHVTGERHQSRYCYTLCGTREKRPAPPTDEVPPIT